MANSINIRVLQHETNDSIRIGIAHRVIDLQEAEKEIISGYDIRMADFGGFTGACQKFFKRIAIVDADTLKVIKSLYDQEPKEYAFIISDSKGKLLGSISIQAFALPGHQDICDEARSKYPNAYSYKLISKYGVEMDDCPIDIKYQY